MGRRWWLHDELDDHYCESRTEGEVLEEHPRAVDWYLGCGRPEHAGQNDTQQSAGQAWNGGLDGRHAGNQPGRSTNQAQGGESFPALGRAQHGRDADQQQHREEHRDSAQ